MQDKFWKNAAVAAYVLAIIALGVVIVKSWYIGDSGALTSSKLTCTAS